MTETSSDERAPLVFLDTETTGLHPGREVWEVAMIRRDEHGEREWEFFVEVDLSRADPFGLRVGRFYDRHPQGRYLSDPDLDADRWLKQEGSKLVPPADAARMVARVTHEAHLVGAVPNFDAETLDPLLRAHGLIPAWHYHLIDVEALAVGYLRGRAEHEGYTPTPLPWKSDDLSALCGVMPASDEERHTALGDARWAMRLYDAIVPAPLEDPT